MSETNAALEILELTLIPGSLPPVYAVGLVASRITFADQQRRAINIIWALLSEGRVSKGDQIAVIGGGIAGTTAAVYALQQGLCVTVFEKHGDSFPIQQGSGRWVHPNIYEWPKDGWRDGKTNLPCMNWQAGTAGTVVAHLRSEWEQALKKPELRWMQGTNVETLLPETGTRGFLKDSAGKEHGPFQCIVMAAGFGEEPTYSEIDGKAYWRDDDLHQRIRSGGTAIVSGCGDGGLIDATRIAFRDFRHDWLPRIASMAASDEGLVQELICLEHDTPRYPDGEALTKATLQVVVNDDVVTEIRNRLRPETTVILNGRTSGALTRGACMLNRFIIGQLIKLGIVTYHEGAMAPSSVTRAGDKFACLINGSSIEADVIVVRHGPEKRPLAAFPQLEVALKPVRDFLLTYSAGVDRTRRRLWANLPEMPSPCDSCIPQLTSDVLDYLGENVRSAIQQELIRLKRPGKVALEHLESGLKFRVRETTKTHILYLNFPTEDHLSFSYEKETGEKGKLPIDLAVKATTDAGAAASLLVAKIPRIIEYITGDSL